MPKIYSDSDHMLVEKSFATPFKIRNFLIATTIQTTLVAGAYCAFGLKGALVAFIANAAEITLGVSSGSRIAIAQNERQKFMDRNWVAISATPQFQWLTNEIKNGASRYDRDNKLRLLDLKHWPKDVMKDMYRSAAVAATKMTIPGRIYDGARSIYKKFLIQPPPNTRSP